MGWDRAHHTAEGAAEAMAAGGGVDGQQHGHAAESAAQGCVDFQHHGRNKGCPRKFMPDFDFMKTQTCLLSLTM